MAKKAVIVGWSHIPFGKLIEPDTETLMARVSGGALEHAGITGKDVDGIYVGVMNSGFQQQDFQGALVALADPDLSSVPAKRLENACDTGRSEERRVGDECGIRVDLGVRRVIHKKKKKRL